jgi:hypothetical protein
MRARTRRLHRSSKLSLQFTAYMTVNCRMNFRTVEPPFIAAVA